MEISKAANYHDFSGLAALRVDAKVDSEQAIAPVVRQFEALFLQMMLKSMRDAVPEGGLFEDSGRAFYQDMHDKQLAVTLADQGGVGLADSIVRQLSAPQISPAAPALSPAGEGLRQSLQRPVAKVLPTQADESAMKRGP